MSRLACITCGRSTVRLFQWGNAWLCPDCVPEVLNQQSEQIAALAAERDRLQAEVERLREALEWVRDASNVAPDWRRFPGSQAVYMHAKKALEETNND